MTIEIPLTTANRNALLQIGLRAPSGTSLKLHPKSWFEAPTNISASFNAGFPVCIGAFTLLNSPWLMHCSIGRYCSLATSCTIGSAEHPLDFLTSSTAATSPDFMGWQSFVGAKDFTPIRHGAPGHTDLGNDVWIGHGAYIRSGVKIGHGAVVGARAVVTRDVEPYAIVAGSPARLLRYRFEPDIIDRLLRIQWWNYSVFDFKIPLNDVLGCLDWLEENAGNLTPYVPLRYSPADLLDVCSPAEA